MMGTRLSIGAAPANRAVAPMFGTGMPVPADVELGEACLLTVFVVGACCTVMAARVAAHPAVIAVAAEDSATSIRLPVELPTADVVVEPLADWAGMVAVCIPWPPAASIIFTICGEPADWVATRGAPAALIRLVATAAMENHTAMRLVKERI